MISEECRYEGHYHVDDICLKCGDKRKRKHLTRKTKCATVETQFRLRR